MPLKWCSRLATCIKNRFSSTVKRSSGVLEDWHTWKESAAVRMHMHSNSTVRTVFTTHCLFLTALKSFTVWRTCKNKGFPRLGQVITFCNSQKPTLEASHACSPCVQVKHSEELWKEPERACLIGCAAAHQNMHETPSSQRFRRNMRHLM